MLSITQITDEADALHRFHAARAALRSFLVSAQELRCRASRILNKTDKRRVAIERCLSGGIGNFRSCADAYAYLYAKKHTGCGFTGFGTWGDALYGRNLDCGSRVDLWDRFTVPPYNYALN